MNRYHRFVRDFAKLATRAGHVSPKPVSGPQRYKPRPHAPTALLFSPHPDDECIAGGLALRLLREAKWNVVNVAVTLGSKKLRRAARLKELANACDYLGFSLIVAGAAGLENINLHAHRKNLKWWSQSVKVIAEILKKVRPRVIFIPHEQDRHETHIGTHFLIMDALKKMPARFQCFVVETEFWGQLTDPNLVVEIKSQDLADLVSALSFHVGEVKRNAYHLRLPAWMMDNVRRAETVGTHGSAAPNFVFANIYRLRKWKRGRLVDVLKRGKFLSCAENPRLLFP